MNHCLSFEQVSDEVSDYYRIKEGDFDTISNCHYSVPSYLDIGKLYSIMIENPVGVAPQCWELSVNLNELYLYVLKYVL